MCDCVYRLIDFLGQGNSVDYLRFPSSQKSSTSGMIPEVAYDG